MNARAYCGDLDDDGRDAFAQGLTACGYEVMDRLPSAPRQGDVWLTTWSARERERGGAVQWEDEGGVVLVAEDGYVGRDDQGRRLFALARKGTWSAGGPERWKKLGLAIQPWRTTGDHILLCPNRADRATRGQAMPQRWPLDAIARLRAVSRRPIRVRMHPSASRAARPLAADLDNAHAVVIWSSSAGVHALLAGVPVVAMAPNWICRSAAEALPENVEQPAMPDRTDAFERLAWAQWTVNEIASGEPFRRLLT